MVVTFQPFTLTTWFWTHLIAKNLGFHFSVQKNAFVRSSQPGRGLWPLQPPEPQGVARGAERVKKNWQPLFHHSNYHIFNNYITYIQHSLLKTIINFILLFCSSAKDNTDCVMFSLVAFSSNFRVTGRIFQRYTSI